MVVLLVEDNIHVQFLAWKLLKASGHTVVKAGDCEAGLQCSRNYPGPIDLLLTDIDMPHVNGLELYQRIAAERPGIKVLFMTSDIRLVNQSSTSGLPCLHKPFTAEALFNAIQSVPAA